MKDQRRYAPISGRFAPESVAGLTGISSQGCQQEDICFWNDKLFDVPNTHSPVG